MLFKLCYQKNNNIIFFDKLFNGIKSDVIIGIIIGIVASLNFIYIKQNNYNINILHKRF